MAARGRDDPERSSFRVKVSGDRIEGRAPGIDRAKLRRLKSGQLAVESDVDLHALDAKTARRVLREALAAAWEEGQRCVLVVHGKGIHSEGEPVLRSALVGWLEEPPLASRVLAFVSAAPRDGGAGATYVLLRRQR